MADMTVLGAGTRAGTGGYSEDALDYLKSVYNDPLQPTHIRMKAAGMALEFERPRLAVTTNLNMGVKDFSEELESRRVGRMKLIQGQAQQVGTSKPQAGRSPEDVSAQALTKGFPSLNRRRL